MRIKKKNLEIKVIQIGILAYWFLFWLLNVVDKFIGKSTFLWVGKDRFSQLVNYFASIGIENETIPYITLVFSTILEIIALLLLTFALFKYLSGHYQKARDIFFWGTFVGLAIFSFFSIGDQVFGDRVELLEHTTYWIALIISWGAYVYFPKHL